MQACLFYSYSFIPIFKSIFKSIFLKFILLELLIIEFYFIHFDILST